MAEEKKMNIVQKLSMIQNEMKVPKNLYNKFGNFYYRNCETILETAKPICAKYKTTLIVTDAVIYENGRFYIKAIATLYDWESDDILEGQAVAREEDIKGMQASQVTGSTSSYARKYALNGLFNLDDEKDADAQEPSEEEEKQSSKKNEVSLEEMRGQLTSMYTIEELDKIFAHYNIEKLADMDAMLVTKYYKGRAK